MWSKMSANITFCYVRLY